jgi:hypothetical protein
MGRIVFLVGVLLGLFLLPARLVLAGTALEIGKMKAALRTATPEEDGFLKRVSKLVENDVLPRSLVETTFLWARKKPDHKFQYFKRGLIARAKQQGIQM